ncbi:tetratricopeptide repeat protein [Elizabethkingia anophelis]|nr:tetratricopeptide repeat protein [Elizabethkingia anophelis]MCT4274427.1 tetratricopeptide repeat protein [Elizabethkingia anophelis]MCT4292052.1 tetratricopeptide repeat protein [Elizabethkingia anophelis]
MMKISYILILLLLIPFANAQSLDDLYQQLRKEVNNSPEKVIQESKILKKKGLQANAFKIISKADYIASFAFYLKGNPDSCIYYANNAIQSANRNKYTEGEALALRMLGTQYAKMGLLDKSKELLDRALIIVSKQQNNEAYEIRGMIYSSMLVLMDDNKNLNKKIEVAQNALKSYLKVNDVTKRTNLLPTAYTNLCFLYSKTKKYDSAYIYSQKALNYIDINDTYKLASVYHDIGYLLFSQNKLSEAISNYQKALGYCKSENFYDKKLEILKGLSDAYAKAGDNRNALDYLQQYQELDLNAANKNGYTINKIYNIVDKKNNSNTTLIFIIVGNIILVLVVYFLTISKKKIKEVIPEKKEETRQLSDHNISKETEDRILKNLEEFENNKTFIAKDISLFSVANQFQTNTKYLSIVLKKNKNKVFTQYINDLRIQYIIDKLKTDSNFSKYKIYYLSELSGFSSQRAFTTAFSNRTKMKPLEYIKKYCENLNEKNEM